MSSKNVSRSLSLSSAALISSNGLMLFGQHVPRLSKYFILCLHHPALVPSIILPVTTADWAFLQAVCAKRVVLSAISAAGQTWLIHHRKTASRQNFKPLPTKTVKFRKSFIPPLFMPLWLGLALRVTLQTQLFYYHLITCTLCELLYIQIIGH